jgi:Flp pilus assembly protein TadD
MTRKGPPQGEAEKGPPLEEKQGSGKPPAKRSDEAEKRFRLGQDRSAEGKWPEAERAFREALKLFPEDAQTYVQLGVAFEAQQKEEKAEAAYRKAIWFAPENPEAYFRLGGLLENQALVLGQAEHLEPHTFPDGSEARKKHHEAEWEYHEALRLKPDHLEALKRMAALLDAQGRNREARRYWNRALPLETDPSEKQRMQERLATREEELEEAFESISSL